jgi:ATP-dependent DNA helicase RecG
MAKSKKAIGKVNELAPRQYMQMAIEEMNKSLNEPRPDGKVPPKVGAVIVFPDGRVERAYRGEFREGDHAEYTLIERKLPKEKLEECTLYTTLEPCVERNPPKVPCCRRTTNARIKNVYVGITDPDPTVDGKGIKHLEAQGAKVLMFDRDLQQIIETVNAQFRTQALERKRVKEEEAEIILTPFELAIPNTDLSQFSTEALEKFIKEAKLSYKSTDKEFQPFLEDLGAMKLDEKTNTYRPTGMGILLFGKNPRAKYKQAALMASVDYGDYKIEPATFDQPLVLIPDLLENWLKKSLALSKDTSSFKRKDVPDFPIDVIREAVINALMHRDFGIEGAKCYLEIDNEKIVVKSPGAPLPSITLEKLNTFKASSQSRNPVLTYVFGLMDYMEEKGFGMRLWKSLNEKGLPVPEYTLDDPYLTLTFPRTMEVIKNITGVASIVKLTDEELAGYEWVKAQGEVSAKDYATHFKITPRTASRHLGTMLKFKIVRTNNENLKSPKLRYITI